MQHIYLNNAATSYPKSPTLSDIISQYIKTPPTESKRQGGRGMKDVAEELRLTLSDFLHAPSAGCITFSSGATESLNMIIRGLSLENKTVITSAAEHNSVLRPLKTLERQKFLKIEKIGCDLTGRIKVSELKDRLAGNVGAVILTHCSNVTGFCNDIQSITDVVQPLGIPIIIDASQSVGNFSIDVQEWGVDALVFTAHKALLGLQGFGGAYLAPSFTPEPLKTGGTGTRSDYLFQPEEMPTYYEAGTPNMPGMISTLAGIQYINERGIDVLRQIKEQHCRKLRCSFENNSHIHIIPTETCDAESTIFSFTVDGMDPDDVAYLLYESYNISVRAGLHCAPWIHEYIGTAPWGCIRVSPSCFTTDEEIDLFIDAVEQIVVGISNENR